MGKSVGYVCGVYVCVGCPWVNPCARAGFSVHRLRLNNRAVWLCAISILLQGAPLRGGQWAVSSLSDPLIVPVGQLCSGEHSRAEERRGEESRGEERRGRQSQVVEHS